MFATVLWVAGGFLVNHKIFVAIMPSHTKSARQLWCIEVATCLR